MHVLNRFTWRSEGRVRGDFEALDMLPADGDLDGLVNRVAQDRKRPIVVIRAPLPHGISGLWDERHAAKDIVVIDQVPMAPSRYAAVLCHELAHMILGHHGIVEMSAQPADVSFIDATVARRFLKRCAYDDTIERNAEELATVLTREHLRRAHANVLRENRISSRLR